jgi:hypothetical protein
LSCIRSREKWRAGSEKKNDYFYLLIKKKEEEDDDLSLQLLAIA